MKGDLIEIFQDGCLRIFLDELIIFVDVLAQFCKVEAGADVVIDFEGHLVVLGENYVGEPGKSGDGVKFNHVKYSIGEMQIRTK